MRDFVNERLEAATDRGYLRALTADGVAVMVDDSGDVLKYGEECALIERVAMAFNACRDALGELEAPAEKAGDDEAASVGAERALNILRRAVRGSYVDLVPAGYAAQRAFRNAQRAVAEAIRHTRAVIHPADDELGRAGHEWRERLADLERAAAALKVAPEYATARTGAAAAPSPEPPVSDTLEDAAQEALSLMMWEKWDDARPDQREIVVRLSRLLGVRS